LKTTVIREARLSKGYSQENISIDLDMSQSQYSRRESGIIDFSLKEIRKLCEILELDLKDTLIELIEDLKTNPPLKKGTRKEIKSKEILEALQLLIDETNALTSVVRDYNDN